MPLLYQSPLCCATVPYSYQTTIGLVSDRYIVCIGERSGGRIGAMLFEEMVIEPIRWYELRKVARMTLANLSTVDQQLKRLLRNFFSRQLVRIFGPVYLSVGGRGYKATAHGQILGCAFLSSRKKSCYIYNVQVNAFARRKGVGFRLMKKMEALAMENGHTAVALLVDKRNEAGRALYDKLGYRRYFGMFWRRRIPDGWPLAENAAAEVRPVRGPQAQQLFNTYQYHELLNGDRWAASIVANDFPASLPRAGQYFQCLHNDLEIGFAWSDYVGDRPVVNLYLSRTVWGNPNVLRGLLYGIRHASGFRSSYLDLYLGSSIHSQASAANLINMGFKPETRARLLLIKDLGASQPIPSDK